MLNLNQSIKKIGKQGFSLVELMVVVAIIGILAAVAVPQYSKFQNKARQSEAKSDLGAIYTVEKTYQSENGTFSPCLVNIGYSRTTAGSTYYAVGFGLDVTPPATPQPCTGLAAGTSHWSATKALVGTAVSAIPGGNSSWAQTGFTAAAAGSLVGAGNDIWKIDQESILNNSLQNY